MMTQQQLPFPSHRKERIQSGTDHVEKNHVKFSGDNLKLMQFWQTRWYWLSNEDGRTFGISSYLSARIHDLIKLGIPIEKKSDGNIKRFRLKCTCRIVNGQDVTDGCYVHSKDLKL